MSQHEAVECCNLLEKCPKKDVLWAQARPLSWVESDFSSSVRSLRQLTLEEGTGAACGDPRQNFILLFLKGSRDKLAQGV